MDSNLKRALQDALEDELSWADNFDNPYENHAFSSSFEKRMKKIIQMSDYKYTNVGSARIRKTTLAIIIAAAVSLLITGCAFAIHCYVGWSESDNSTEGVKVITFDTDETTSEQEKNSFIPETPAGFSISSRSDTGSIISIEFTNTNGEQILFSSEEGIDNISISIDNEKAELEEIAIDGYKGYTYYRDGINAMIWTDTNHFYTLQGNCDLEILLRMVK